jgi:hypothetical protein
LIIVCYLNYFDHSVYDAATDAEMVIMMALTLGWTMPNPTQFTDWGYQRRVFTFWFPT